MILRKILIFGDRTSAIISKSMREDCTSLMRPVSRRFARLARGSKLEQVQDLTIEAPAAAAAVAAAAAADGEAPHPPGGSLCGAHLQLGIELQGAACCSKKYRLYRQLCGHANRNRRRT